MRAKIVITCFLIMLSVFHMYAQNMIANGSFKSCCPPLPTFDAKCKGCQIYNIGSFSLGVVQNNYEPLCDASIYFRYLNNIKDSFQFKIVGDFSWGFTYYQVDTSFLGNGINCSHNGTIYSLLSRGLDSAILNFPDDNSFIGFGLDHAGSIQQSRFSPVYVTKSKFGIKLNKNITAGKQYILNYKAYHWDTTYYYFEAFSDCSLSPFPDSLCIGLANSDYSFDSLLYSCIPSPGKWNAYEYCFTSKRNCNSINIGNGNAMGYMAPNCRNGMYLNNGYLPTVLADDFELYEYRGLDHKDSLMVCIAQINKLKAGPILSGETLRNYEWNNKDTSEEITIKKEGWYWVRKYDFNFGLSIDSFYVHFFGDSLLKDLLPADETICKDTLLLLQSKITKNTYHYLWNTGDSSDRIYISQSGTYSLTVIDSNCSAIDSVHITIQPMPIKLLCNDTFFCKGTVIQLRSVIQGPGKFLWNNGDTTIYSNITKEGKYTLVYELNGCSIKDSVYVSESPLPIIQLAADTFFCFDDLKQIKLDAGPFKNFLWEPTGETSRFIYSSTAQNYKLTVTDSNNCKDSKNISVQENCSADIYIPNAFTANGDGLNDTYTIYLNNKIYDFIELSIFNRWGGTIFKSNNQQTGWNGYYNGQEVPAGVYLVQFKYSDKASNTQRVKLVNLTLLR